MQCHMKRRMLRDRSSTISNFAENTFLMDIDADFCDIIVIIIIKFVFSLVGHAVFFCYPILLQ